ncbi:MAG TPA: site-specific integrase [Terrimicrobiaceae bacterium]
MYLHRRGSHWWIRKAVPIDLAEFLGIFQLRRSLRTRDAALARRRALQLLVQVDDVYAVLRSKRPLMPTRQLALALLDDALSLNSGTEPMVSHRAEMIQRAQNAVFDFLVADIRHAEGEDAGDQLAPHDGIGQQRPILVTKTDALQLLKSETAHGAENALATSLLQAVDLLASADVKKVREGMQSAIETIRSALASRPSPHSHPVVPQSQENHQAASIYDALLQMQKDLQYGLAEMKSVVAERAGVNAAVAPQVDAATVAEAIREAERSRWSAELLSVMIARYYEDEVKPGSVGLKHKEDVKKRLSNFLEFTGDKPVRDVTRDDLEIYRDHLDKLPDRYELRFKTQDMRKAIVLNSKLIKPFPIIGPITVNLKYLGPVRRFFEWLDLKTLISKNPAAKVHSTSEEKEDEKRKRLPLRADQINRLFGLVSKESKSTAVYWLPPLMLFTGARPNELAQLRTDDLRDYNNRLHLSVLCLDEEGDEDADEGVKLRKKVAEDRSVKSPAGRRLIPVHDELLKMGFPKFILARRKRAGAHCQVFSDLKPDRFGHWSAAISKRINRRLRSLGITNERLTAYSLRHNFRDACVSAQISEEARKKFMGHQLEGMDGVYGNPNPLPHESAMIDLVKFPEVDLGDYLRKQSATK